MEPSYDPPDTLIIVDTLLLCKRPQQSKVAETIHDNIFMQRLADDRDLSGEHLLLSAASPDFCQKVPKGGAKRCQKVAVGGIENIEPSISDDEPVCSLLIAGWVSASSQWKSSLLKGAGHYSVFILLLRSQSLQVVRGGGRDLG